MFIGSFGNCQPRYHSDTEQEMDADEPIICWNDLFNRTVCEIYLCILRFSICADLDMESVEKEV